MARINLLPWREEQRKEQQQQFVTILGLSVILMVLIIVAIHLQFSRAISIQNSRNNFLQTHITKVEQQIAEITRLEKDKQRLLDRIEKIQILQRNRPEVVHLFDELVRVLPEGVYLTNFTQKGKSLSLQGKAQSNARVSALMRAVDKSDWLSKPILDVIKNDSKTDKKDRSFKLKARQFSKIAKEEKKKKKKKASRR